MAKELHSSYIPHERVEFVPVGPSMTRQEFAEECDINALMARYEKHGVWPMLPEKQARFLDLEGVPDFAAAMQLVIDAEAAFMTLPAHVRREFDNDPAQFVEFASDRENLEQMREWGLAPPEKLRDAPQRVEIVNPPELEDKPPAKP